VLDALGDPTRRAILESLRRGERPVGQIASRLPVSRPAVSQHLKVLKRAGLVAERHDGTRRFYRLNPLAIVELRSYLDRYWTAGLANLKAIAESDFRRKGS
jgi:DNA-binding transcriptional ArsR family regulator